MTIAARPAVHLIQAYEYAHAPFGFGDNIYTSAFFMATGFHGFHVIVGTIFLIVCLVRAYKGHFTPAAAFRLRGGGLVLAFRRRGLAVPVPVHLRLGRLGRGISLDPRHPGEGRDLGETAVTSGPETPAFAGMTPFAAALRGLCPRCGDATLFAGLATFAPNCRACGLDFAAFNVGDGPAAFLIFIVGGLVVGARDRGSSSAPRRPGGCTSCSGCR